MGYRREEGERRRGEGGSGRRKERWKGEGKEGRVVEGSVAGGEGGERETSGKGWRVVKGALVGEMSVERGPGRKEEW